MQGLRGSTYVKEFTTYVLVDSNYETHKFTLKSIYIFPNWGTRDWGR